MENFIEKIITNNTHCYFISPSFGDAASSTGEVMSALSGKVEITVINIFTKPEEGTYTFSAKQFLKHSAATNPHELYENRIQEDAVALAIFPATVKNINATDALWRKKKHKNMIGNYIAECNSLYPTYKHIMSGKISKEDHHLEKDLIKKLHAIVASSEENYIIFCPIGFFAHVDYILVRNLCWNEFQKNCIFYSLPINDMTNKIKHNFVKNNQLEQAVFTNSSEKKSTILKAYASQTKQFDLAYRPEIYYLQKPHEKKNITVTLHKTLTDEILKDWQELWNDSRLKNFFNAPLWFQATMKTFAYTESLLVTCYENKKLVGILPVVQAKKYGISAYVTPGNHYYDNSSLLLKNNDSEIVIAVLKKLAEVGNFYLSEMGQPIANTCSTFMKSMDVVPASKSPYFRLQPDPYRFISKKNKRILAKKFKDAGEHISFMLYQDAIDKHLETLFSIDDTSAKKDKLKNTFADPLLEKLLKNIYTLQNKKVSVALLFYENKPIAYNYGLLYGNTFMGTGTAFKKEWSYLSPGRLLVYSLLPQLIEIGIENFDFSRGISRFKTDFTPYFYQQYAISFSINPRIQLFWKTLDGVKNYLEAHPSIFEFVRRTKKIIMR